VIEEVSSSGVVYYVREPGGELVASLRGGSVYYYHFDGLGSTRGITDSAGNVTDTYSYDAWGNVTSHNGSTSQPYQFVGQLGYYTHYQEPEFGLMQLGVRFYDPAVGRFTQRDPILSADESNYLYVSAKPLVLTDPTGAFSWPTTCTIWHLKFKSKCDVYDISTGRYMRTRQLNRDVHSDECAKNGLRPGRLLIELNWSGNCRWDSPGGIMRCSQTGGLLGYKIPLIDKLPQFIWPWPPRPRAGVRMVCVAEVEIWHKLFCTSRK